MEENTYKSSSAWVNFISILCFVKNVCFGNGVSIFEGWGIGFPRAMKQLSKTDLDSLSFD